MWIPLFIITRNTRLKCQNLWRLTGVRGHGCTAPRFSGLQKPCRTVWVRKVEQWPKAPVSRWENNISGTWSWTLKDTNQRQRRIKVNIITRLATYEWSDNFKEGKMIVSNKEIQSICNIFAQCQTHLFKLNQFPNLFHCLQKCKKCCKKCHILLMT